MLMYMYLIVSNTINYTAFRMCEIVAPCVFWLLFITALNLLVLMQLVEAGDTAFFVTSHEKHSENHP